MRRVAAEITVAWRNHQYALRIVHHRVRAERRHFFGCWLPLIPFSQLSLYVFRLPRSRLLPLPPFIHFEIHDITENHFRERTSHEIYHRDPAAGCQPIDHTFLRRAGIHSTEYTIFPRRTADDSLDDTCNLQRQDSSRFLLSGTLFLAEARNLAVRDAIG